jgi:4-aminobutyrate aminotransferase-like enzyme
MGTYAQSGLRALKKQYPIIGDVRGLGLMIGIELVADVNLAPAPAAAEALQAFCLKNGLIVGLGGIDGNVIRFQPPLVISKSQIDQALAIIAQGLKRA